MRLRGLSGGFSMSKARLVEPKIDPKVVSRLGHVLWRIDNEAAIKQRSREENVANWQQQKQPFLAKAREIVRLATTLELIAPD